MKFFTISDHHFNHRNIIKYCKRPFESVEEMNQKMIDNWNSVVSTEDHVLYLGDFTLQYMSGFMRDIMNSLNGVITFVYGNHDRQDILKAPRWKEVLDEKNFKYKGYQFFTRHHPFEDDEMIDDEKTIYLHGHSHGNLGQVHGNIPQIDVSVDCWNYTPVELDHLIRIKKIVTSTRELNQMFHNSY